MTTISDLHPRRLARLVLLVLLASSAGGGDPAGAQELARLFPEEADVFTPAAGLVRLPLPATVLRAARPDLADLRLFDRAGREVPYLIDAGAPPGWERREQRRADGQVLDLVREETPRENLPPRTREVYRVALPDAPPAGEAWTLVVRADRPRFVRSVAVQGTDRTGRALDLVPRASLVRLGQKLADRDRVPLPPFDGDEITVTIEGEDGAFLEPTFLFESARTLDPNATLDGPLAIRSTVKIDGRTVLELERPTGPAPARLHLTTSTPALDRRVWVFDLAPGERRTPIGTGRIVRALGAPLEERMDIDVGVARGQRLALEIDDGDSPPLADLQVAAITRQAALLFALPPAAEGSPAGVLRFGGDRAWPPRYDIADLFRDATGRDGAALEATPLPEARLGAVRANPTFDSGPALAALLRPGAPVDPVGWRWHRSLTIPPSRDGLASFRLTPADLAHARPDQADLRVIDSAGRQWPFLVVPGGARASVALEIAGPRTADHVSRWRLTSRDGPLPLSLLEISPAVAVLDRPFRVVATDEDGEERVLAEGTLTQDLRRPRPIPVPLRPARLETVELVVEDGDDAPLRLERVESEMRLPEVLVAAPAGTYTLLAGNPDATAPSYELARARDVVLGLRSVAATAGPAAENPSWDGTPGGRAAASERRQQMLVWAAIALAVVVLGALTLRVARA